MRIADVVGVSGLDGYAVLADVVLPVAIVVDGNEEFAFGGLLGGPIAAHEEDVPVGFEASDQRAEGVTVNQVRFVVGAGFLESIWVCRPAVSLPA